MGTPRRGERLLRPHDPPAAKLLDQSQDRGEGQLPPELCQRFRRLRIERAAYPLIFLVPRIERIELAPTAAVQPDPMTDRAPR